MKLVFHGTNSHTFRPGIEDDLDRPHEIAEVDDALASDDAARHFQEADVIVGIRLAASMPVGPRLRLYQLPAAGHDGIDRAQLPMSVPLCNCYGHEDAIAEYVMAALLARHVPLAAADADLRLGKWTYWAGGPAGLRTELGGSTVGILGFGDIGRTIARRAKAFGMRVEVANRSAVDDPAVDFAHPLGDLHAVLGTADYVVVTLPLTEATAGLIDAEALARMRPTAVLINVGRGPVVAERALFDALASGRIGGAVIDTWYAYPSSFGEPAMPAALPFHELTNLVMTPHMSGWTWGTIVRRRRAIAENVNRLCQGRPLLHQLPR